MSGLRGIKIISYVESLPAKIAEAKAARKAASVARNNKAAADAAARGQAVSETIASNAEAALHVGALKIGGIQTDVVSTHHGLVDMNRLKIALSQIGCALNTLI